LAAALMAAAPLAASLMATPARCFSAICHLPSAICHPPSAIRHPPSAIRHPSAIRERGASRAQPPTAIRERGESRAKPPSREALHVL